MSLTSYLLLGLLCVLLVSSAKGMESGEGSQGSSGSRESGNNSGRGRPFMIREINNYLLFTVSWERKKKEKPLDENLLKDIACAVLLKAEIYDIEVSKRIVCCFKTKLVKLLNNTAKAGWRQFSKFVDSLKTSEPYRLKIFVNETNKPALVKDIERLNGEVENFKNVATAAQDKLLKAESSGKYWKGQFRSAFQRLMKQQQQSQKRMPKIKYFDYSKRSKSHVRQVLKDNCQSTLQFMGLYDFVPYKVEFYDPITMEKDSLLLVENKAFNPSGVDEPTTTSNELDDVQLLLYVKEKFNVSDSAWREISAICEPLPKTYSLKQRMATLNKKWDISLTPGFAVGVQMKLKGSLVKEITTLVGNGAIVDGETIKVKISGDGTNIGKRLQLLNVSYTIINTGKNAATEKGNHILAIIKTKDDYAGIRDCLADLRGDISKLRSVNIKGTDFTVQYFLGGVWKCLATVCGVGSANHKYACI